MKSNLKRQPSSRTAHRKSHPYARRPSSGLQSWRAHCTALLSLLVLLVGMTGCQQPTGQYSGGGGTAAPAPYTSTLMAEGDTIRVAVEGDTNSNPVVKIQLDGTISLPLVGAVKAVGLTPEQLRTNLMERYKNLLSVNE